MPRDQTQTPRRLPRKEILHLEDYLQKLPRFPDSACFSFFRRIINEKGESAGERTRKIPNSNFPAKKLTNLPGLINPRGTNEPRNAECPIRGEGRKETAATDGNAGVYRNVAKMEKKKLDRSDRPRWKLVGNLH